MCDRELADVEAAPGIWCDPCIEPIVQALNAGGLGTVASCCGHGERPGKIALTDRRELFIVPDFDAARRFDDFAAGTDESAVSSYRRASTPQERKRARAILLASPDGMWRRDGEHREGGKP